MKKGIKIGLGFITLLAVLLVGAVIAVKVLVTPERVKELVVPLAEDHLQRKVLLGDVDISLFSGIQLQEFAVRNREDSGNFVATDALVLTYQFMPLLSGQVVVDEVRLVNPQIRIERLKDGTFNFSDLLPKEKGQGSAEPVRPGKASSKDIPLQLAQAAIVNGRVEFADHLVSPNTPLMILIDQIEARVSDLAPGKPAAIEVSALVNETPFKSMGTVNPDKKIIDLTLGLDRLPVGDFGPYFASQIPGKLKSLLLTVDLTVKGGAEQLNLGGYIAGQDLSLVLDALPEAVLEKASFRFEPNLSLNAGEGQLTLDKTRVLFNQIDLLAEGSVQQLFQVPAVDLQLTLPEKPIQELLASLPQGLVAPATQFNPDGAVSLDLVLKGTTQDPLQLLQAGALRFNKVSGMMAGYQPVMDGTLKIQGRGLKSEQLATTIAGQKITLDLQVEDLLAQPLKGSVDVRSDRISLTRIMAQNKSDGQGGASASPSAKPSGKAGSAQEMGPYDIPVDLKGTIRIDEVEYNGILARNLVTDLALRKNILTVDPVQAEVGDGQVGGKARVDLGVKGLSYRSDIGVKKVAIEKVIGGFWPKLAGAVLGRISLDLEGKGTGTQTASLRKNLSGKGQLQLFQGKLAKSQLTQGLVEQTRIQELESLSFSKIALDFLIQKGKLSLGGTADGKEARFSPKGDVGLDGGLNMNLGMKMSPELADKAVGGRLGKLLRDSEGWAAVPVKLGGTLTSPQVLLDEKALQKQLLEKGKQKLEKKLLKKLFKTPETSSEPSRESSPEKQLLNDTLKNLLGN